MKKVPLLALGAAAMLSLPAAAVAQDAQPQMLFVYQETVKPSMVQEYEAGTKDFLKAMAAVPMASGNVTFQTISTSEFDYFYVMNVDGFAGIGEMNAKFEKVWGSVGAEQVAKMQELSSNAVVHGASQVIMLREDLSYNVESTAISGEMPFRKYWWWHVIPGKEQQLEAVAKEYVALYKAKNAQAGFRVYQVVVGPELPLYLVVASAKDEAEFATRGKMMEETLGYEGAELSQKALKVARKLVIQEGWVRPDLSFPQPMDETGGGN